jgi:hypothetical protein
MNFWVFPIFTGLLTAGLAQVAYSSLWVGLVFGVLATVVMAYMIKL